MTYRFARYLPLIILALAACTQQPAQITDKGREFYGREHEQALDSPTHETYDENSPRFKEGYARPVDQAAVGTVGVADLPPPSSNVHAPALAVASHPPEPLYPEKPSKVLAADNAGRFIWPVAGGKIVSHFGAHPDGKSNDGINIAATDNEPISASADGTVVYAGNELKGYGNMVILRHDDGWMTAYAHASSIAVKKGDFVKQGTIIGYVGMTGGVKTPQVHFAIRNGKNPVDPEKYLPPQASIVAQ